MLASFKYFLLCSVLNLFAFCIIYSFRGQGSPTPSTPLSASGLKILPNDRLLQVKLGCLLFICDRLAISLKGIRKGKHRQHCIRSGGVFSNFKMTRTPICLGVTYSQLSAVDIKLKFAFKTISCWDNKRKEESNFRPWIS